MRTPAQEMVLSYYRTERRLGLDPFSASRMVRGIFADDIAAMVAHGGTGSRIQLDRYRCANQWHMQILARNYGALLPANLVRNLRDANRQAVSS